MRSAISHWRERLDNKKLVKTQIASATSRMTFCHLTNFSHVQKKTLLFLFRVQTTNVPAVNKTEIEIGAEIFNAYDQNDEEEEEDFEDDFGEFEEKSQRKKLAKQLKDEEEMRPIVEDQELKMTEMVKLYGEKEAKEILAMETAMEMRFQKLKDVKSAKLWPCLPLNMKF
jgi:hypothetical protein